MKFLRIYLNDHLAGSVIGVELAERCLSNNRGTRFESALSALVDEIAEDRAELVRLMETLSITRDRLKGAAAWTAEKVGRLKLNGKLTGYSDLSRVLELEGLCIGVEGKSLLWRSLKKISGTDTRLAVADFDRLIERAERQKGRLEELRLDAATEALG